LDARLPPAQEITKKQEKNDGLAGEPLWWAAWKILSNGMDL